MTEERTSRGGAGTKCGGGATQKKVAAAEGWFTMDDAAPELLGRRGTETGSYYFPPTLAFSRNPAAPAEELEEVALSRPRSHLVLDDQPLQAAGAVRLARPVRAVHRRRGRAAGGADGRARPARPGSDPEALAVGQDVELALTTLYEDEEHEYVVWAWRKA